MYSVFKGTMSLSPANLARNYLFKEKYGKKNPGKYAKFDRILPTGDAHHSWRDPGAIFDDVQDKFNRGLSQWTGHDNRREQRSPHRQGGSIPSIQLVRR